MKNAKALTLTYLTPVSFASLNGSDKETDNISSIKKISVGVEQFPYVSSQAVRRALRNQLEVLGRPLSEGIAASISKGAATTKQEPDKYIDDDLFGYMGTEGAEGKTKGKATKRTSVVRVSPLIALNSYQGDLDFGTNYMGVKSGGDPNIFETEIHSGLYRGTILIELDRVGSGDGFEKDLDNKEKAARVKDLLSAVKNLWASGRQTRFLADISPKFIAAAILKTKNPIFLESVQVEGKKLNVDMIKETLKDYNSEIVSSVIGVRKGFFIGDIENSKSIGDAFDEIAKWIDQHYV
ncbi:CRISPR-associated protein Cas7/Cst2/DevR, subtype I-B/TNEAP [Candidatus Methanoperedens nitroreducens]|uniref:CRISPR-associated protein Cas7/Cst2/DevR, subtype I-B/TNEAP n=1 Tax=Candidatus Methanoperedens nitratireducens TaxID=1392998 RepID=A0A062V9B2_9EURY|nr:type I-B CRISPR-associated protein Cas7/Cst2/DevR [Candidatus Methanoperedens nitroreducens]KCZ73138.1 CRISPR-associated protein Cas7/Cst2/DevR, subtype I-B/TNEAP [Candidatus Methanoperedens nitroreducens]MDJ1422913.1 type I-B CRISPR-associated protein Cas7/Cst2/DevR [Candidatus Methanoperedens sp.]